MDGILRSNEKLIKIQEKIRGKKFRVGPEKDRSRIEAMDYADLWRCAAQIPLEWFEHDGEGLYVLIEELHRRRSFVRNLITAFHHSSRNPFPRWAAHVPILQTDCFLEEEETWPDLVFGASEQ